MSNYSSHYYLIDHESHLFERAGKRSDATTRTMGKIEESEQRRPTDDSGRKDLRGSATMVDDSPPSEYMKVGEVARCPSSSEQISESAKP